MHGKLKDWDDTIVAMATAPGVSAIGVLRISGHASIDIADRLFPSKDLHGQASHTLHVGHLKKQGETLDEVVVSLFRSPRSYTGEDVVEFSLHGSPFVQDRVLQAVLSEGARLAKPGEFTQRAFLNGKLDLTQAEAVADLIASTTEAAQKHALNNIRGGFATVLKGLREQLLTFSALIELELDFSQEDVAFADRKAFTDILTRIQTVVASLVDSFRLGNVIRNGVQVAIVGKPNAGKSTLLNALLNEDRAIVSEIAGTTRDTIEEVINIGGIQFRLIDTAGIREHTTDLIEGFGIERSRQKMDQADIIIYLLDATDKDVGLWDVRKELSARQSEYLIAINKADLKTSEGIAEADDVVLISAKENTNIDQLKQLLVDKVLQGRSATGSEVVTNARHHHVLRQVASAVEDLRRGLDAGLTGDLLSPDIRRALHYLGEITGEVTNEDQLDYIFSKFCIGK